MICNVCVMTNTSKTVQKQQANFRQNVSQPVMGKVQIIIFQYAIKIKCVLLLVLLKVEERREAYVSSYDIVLEKDETLDIPNAILNYITEEK